MKNLLLLVAVLFSISSFSQDIITLKNGDELKGKVIKVGVNAIEYKKDTTSPVYEIKKSEVFMIKYENGSKEVLSNLASLEPKKESLEDLAKRYNRKKRAGIGLTVTGGVLLLGGTSLFVSSLDMSVNSDTGWPFFYTGLSAMIASVPFLITGPIQLHKYAKLKRQWKEEKRSLSFAPTINLNTYGASMRLTF
ncbi:MAG: hypothetical protein KA149_03455 [Chitinophagales bacterium]|nr:hypothetical protein [Chitinophagales bacterium]